MSVKHIGVSCCARRDSMLLIKGLGHKRITAKLYCSLFRGRKMLPVYNSVRKQTQLVTCHFCISSNEYMKSKTKRSDHG